MNDIQRMQVWNKRFKERMEAAGYKTQTEFIKAFNDAYGTKCTQTDVSRWLRVGESSKKYDNKTYKEKEIAIGFPSYINMKRVADMLNVSVAYLTGETDYDSFNLEKACKYTGISQDAMKTICRMTRFDTKNHGVSYSGDGFLWYGDARETISKLFESSKAPGLIHALQELIRVYSGPDKTRSMWIELDMKYGSELINEALKHVDDIPEAGDPFPDDDILPIVEEIREIMNEGNKQQLETEFETDVFRYRAQRAFDDLLDNMFPQE